MADQNYVPATGVAVEEQEPVEGIVVEDEIDEVEIEEPEKAKACLSIPFPIYAAIQCTVAGCISGAINGAITYAIYNPNGSGTGAIKVRNNPPTVWSGYLVTSIAGYQAVAMAIQILVTYFITSPMSTRDSWLQAPINVTMLPETPVPFFPRPRALYGPYNEETKKVDGGACNRFLGCLIGAGTIIVVFFLIWWLPVVMFLWLIQAAAGWDYNKDLGTGGWTQIRITWAHVFTFGVLGVLTQFLFMWHAFIHPKSWPAWTTFTPPFISQGLDDFTGDGDLYEEEEDEKVPINPKHADAEDEIDQNMVEEA